MREGRGSAAFVVAALATGCCPPASVPKADSREVCVVHTETTLGLPRLYRRANAQTLNLGPAPVVCDIPKESRKLADRCEDVDDLSAFLGTGKVCGPSGVKTQRVCPPYPADRIRTEPPEIEAPICSGACENVQIAVHEVSGTVTRILFYDDPACHSAADPACPGAEHRCYYRVLAITSELR